MKKILQIEVLLILLQTGTSQFFNYPFQGIQTYPSFQNIYANMGNQVQSAKSHRKFIRKRKTADCESSESENTDCNNSVGRCICPYRSCNECYKPMPCCESMCNSCSASFVVVPYALPVLLQDVQTPTRDNGNTTDKETNPEKLLFVMTKTSTTTSTSTTRTTSNGDNKRTPEEKTTHAPITTVSSSTDSTSLYPIFTKEKLKEKQKYSSTKPPKCPVLPKKQCKPRKNPKRFIVRRLQAVKKYYFLETNRSTPSPKLLYYRPTISAYSQNILKHFSVNVNRKNLVLHRPTVEYTHKKIESHPTRKSFNMNSESDVSEWINDNIIPIPNELAEKVLTQIKNAKSFENHIFDSNENKYLSSV